jgi:hypothetical protein
MNAIMVTDVEGKQHIVVVSSITGVDLEKGEPGQPAQPAKEAVAASPGRPSSGPDDPGEPPVVAQAAVEVKPAVPGKPDMVIIHRSAGDDVKVHMKHSEFMNMINS